MADTGRIVVRCIVATTRPLSVYGGVEVAEELLENMVSHHRSKPVNMNINHDPTRPLEGRCLDARIIDLDDGFRGLQADFEVNAEQWAAYEAELTATGAPGGMSWSGVETLDHLASGANGSFLLAADAAYFEGDAICEAAQRLTSIGSVRAARLYQFAEVSTCRIILEFLASGIVTVSWGLISAAMYDSLKCLLRYRERRLSTDARPPQIEFQRVDADGSIQTFVVRTDNEEVLKLAIDKLGMVVEPRPTLAEWSEETRSWRRIS